MLACPPRSSPAPSRSPPTGGPTGVLVLHGFTGSPQSMRPLAEALAAAGFSVELPLLPGHGTSVEDMVPTRWSDWSVGRRSRLRRASPPVANRSFVAGLSMGGSLAIWLAERHPEIAGVIVVNPLVEPPATSFRDMLLGHARSRRRLGARASDPTSRWQGAPEIGLRRHADRADALDVRGRRRGRRRLGELRCPVLLFSSRTDHVVPTESGDLLVEQCGGPVERVWLERSFHVATLDYDAPEIEERAVAFVNKLAAPR